MLYKIEDSLKENQHKEKDMKALCMRGIKIERERILSENYRKKIEIQELRSQVEDLENFNINVEVSIPIIRWQDFL